ncbi:Eco57I restriction-modification methylase domain-containing protein [Haladaptatus salinisoli]|uniref:Eco57I restriction-modification methylase domain-containing protein n=1 Tax=Haladaptatus salinisoli TaxID=2884876 RepID=UPI001D0B29CD|nr:TaqI-like C-terminal specificity domain-containing protein [Haladaptatus salinisoli]
MTQTSSVHNALHSIAARIGDDMSEKDVENAFMNENFYTLLGYSGAGHDLRSEWTLPDNRRPDYVTLDANEAVTAIYEFKTSGHDLDAHTDQLFHYVDELKADYGVLTNGEKLQLYSRDGHTEMLAISLEEATESHAADIVAALEKPEWDITNPESVNEYLDNLDAVELDSELGREHFFDTFRLEEDSPFADLVTAMVDLLRELRDENEAKFVKGAYDFWEASYASEPDEIPKSWDAFVDGKQSLRDFMFCLESGHALLARLLLSKATVDHAFFPTNKGLRRYFDALGGFDGEISLDAYPVAANGMIEDMRNQLVESLFEDDIFIWWTDGYAEETASQHKNPYNRFRDVAKDGSEVSRVSRATRERFSRAVAHVVFSVLKFDFSRIEGDPLGNLYQRYFDPETRKALGEFYTPQPVIDYIMDGVGYDVGVSSERIIDPSCGSGTFLVEAVKRYIEDVERYNDDPDWVKHLTELCTRPHIVGLDIHPFAVLMAQIRFMVAILPKYREAKRSNADFTIRRLPIFRTDTLRNERELTGIDLGDDDTTQMTFDAMTEDNQDVLIPVPLPVEVDEDEVDESEREGEFLVQRVRMPKHQTAKMNAEIRNFGEYYAALQGVLDVVKYHMHEGMWEYYGGLEEGIHRYTTREYEGVEEFFEEYVNDILDTVRYLRVEHGDGRLFKMFEDTVLSLVVKNYMEYDYVVGNPPYVRKESILSNYKERVLQSLYEDVYSGNADLSIYFIKRGTELLNEGGKLGYITSSRFTSTAYGSGLRKTLANTVKIDEFSNYEMSNFFEDATAYPCILVLENITPEEDYDINVVYGRKKPDDSEVESVLEEIRDVIRKNGRHTSEYYTTYKTPFSDLDEREWRFTPEEANELFRGLQSKSENSLSEITKRISAGIKTGKNTVFILSAKEVKQWNIEQSILKPIYRGSDIKRYQMGYPDEYLIYTEGVEIEEYPNAHQYLRQHKEALESRKDATFKNKDKKWYELNIPHSEEVMEVEKIICPEMSQRNNYALDKDGRFILNKVFFLQIIDEFGPKLEFLLGLLNSSTLEFFIKQTSSPLQNGYYQFLTRYQERLPVKTGGEQETKIGELVETIRKIIDVENRVRSFPNKYMDNYGGTISYIDYEWQTRRYPVNADIEELDDGRYVVTAGRSDEITAPQMDTGDREERKRKAKYVHAAVDGRNVKKGEEQAIPIPETDDGVQELLDALERDRATVEETSIEELEAEIDEAVYNLFKLTEGEREVIEDYLEVF